MRRRLSEGGRSYANRVAGNATRKRYHSRDKSISHTDVLASSIEYRSRDAYAERMAAMKARLLGDLGLSRVARAREDDAR